MDGTINDFFNEIDQIAPPKETKTESAWQECHDDGSGYSYYWNVKTDEVTWEMPEEYKLWKEQNVTHKPGHLYVPPKSTPLFPSTALSSTKIYKIQNDSQNLISDDNRKATGQTCKRIISSDHNKKAKKSHIGLNDATEEKIVLISSYGDDSEESDAETDTRTSSVQVDDKNQPAVVGPHFPNEMTGQPNSNLNSQSDSDNEEDDIDLLTQIQNRAKVLKDLGGELPPDIRKLVEIKDPDTKTEQPHEKSTEKEKKDVTGFSLLAGYGDSDEEEETQAVVPAITENKMAHSTLFPIPKPIDVAQFSESGKESKLSESQIIVDSRAFHRKRRINIDFANKKPKIEPDTNRGLDEIDDKRQGLGFKRELDSDHNVGVPKTKIKDYPGFQSGGLMFIKSDPLLPTTVEPEKKEIQIQEDTDKSKNETMPMIEAIRKTLNEKLTFLCEGREPASPVQVMIIQMETLYEAVNVGSLTMSYLYKWLKETCSELVKLEKDAAPGGWLLQWDRLNKRYYYRNQHTGDSQWEYPQPDIVGGDEAMDISTTPPPPIDDALLPSEPVTSTTSTTFPLQPPPPPRIKSPTPPPPPTISKNVKQKKKAGKSDNPPLPIEIPPNGPAPPLPQEKLNLHGEPLPPGVESSEITSYKSTSPLPPPAAEDKLPLQSNTNDALGSAINSFYSDLAALESETTITAASDSAPAPAATPAPAPAPPPVPVPSQHTENVTYTNTADDAVVKKKKKTKVKLVQGLAMKKKGVSKLVERWKNVQKDY